MNKTPNRLDSETNSPQDGRDENSNTIQNVSAAEAAGLSDNISLDSPFNGRGRLVTLLLLFFFLGLLDAQIVSPILPQLKTDFSISTQTAGIAVSTYAFAASICALVTGPLSDHFGRLIFLRIAAFFFSGAAVIAFFAQHFGMYLSARVLAGLVGGVISACVIAKIADLFKYERRGRAMGWVGAMQFIAAVIGVPLGLWVTGQWGWRVLYIAFAIAAVLPAIALRKKMIQRFSKGYDRSKLNSPMKSIIRDKIGEYLEFLALSKTRSGLLLALGISATTAGLITYLAVWLTSDFGMSTSELGLVFLITGLTSTIGALLGGWLSDSVGKQRMIVISSLILAIVVIFIARVETRLEIYLVFAAGGLLMGVRGGPFQALITELVPQSQRGAYIALRNSVSQIAIAVSAAICGLLYESFGFVAVSYYAAGFCLIAVTAAQAIPEPKTIKH